jgi:hypothetical protein
VRWLWYVLIGVCLVVAVYVWAIHSPSKVDHRYDKWAQLIILTAVLFGYLLKWGWHYKRRARFWRLYLILLLGHCAAFAAVFSYGRWPIPLLAIVASLEGMALATLIALGMGERL